VQPAPASAATWYVATAANGGNDANSGDAAHPWEHINYAIGKAGDGDTINIGPGWFTEQVIIDKPLTIIGTAVAPTPTGTFIAAPPTASRTTYTAHDGTIFDYVVAAHDNNSISIGTLTIVAADTMKAGATYYANLVFDNVTGPGSGFNAGCASGWASAVIADIGVAVWGGSVVIVQESQIVNFKTWGVWSKNSSPTVYNNEIVSASNNSNCVDLDYCPFALVDNNFLRGDTMPLNINGITVDHCINTTLSNNEIHGVPVGDGIVTFTSAGPIAINTNIIYGFSRGIWDPDAVTGLIVGNEIYSCSSAIRLNNTGSNWTGINNNLLYNCTSAGLYFTCPLANVTGNLINDTGIGLDALNNLTAHCNAIFDNSVAGLNLQVNGTFDVTNNYWGDNSGPNVNGAGPGTGDAITTNGHTVLTFDPWAAMVLSATPPAITADGTSLSTLDLDCTRNSAGVVMGCDIPDGLRVIFATTGGTLTSATTYTHGGHAITALRSSTTPGIFTVTSAFGMAPDMTLSTTIVTFTAIRYCL